MKKISFTKNIVCLILILSIILSLCSCGESEANETGNDNYVVGDTIDDTKGDTESNTEDNIEDNTKDDTERDTVDNVVGNTESSIVGSTENDTIDNIEENTESSIVGSTEDDTESDTKGNTQDSNESDIVINNTDVTVENDTEKSSYVFDYLDYDKVKDYDIIKTEDGYRLVFDDPTIYSRYSEDPGIVGFPINSWEEFCENLLTGKLTYLEKSNIYWTLPKDSNGFIVLNPYVSYKVTHSFPYEDLGSESYFSGYGFEVTLKGKEYYEELMFVGVLDCLGYVSFYDAVFEDIDTEEKIIEYEKELSDGSVMKCYNKTVETVKKTTVVKYILSNGTKTIFVEKKYGNNENSNIPRSIRLLGVIDGDKYFRVNNLFDAPQNLNCEIKEDLSDEFLFGFDLEIVERTVE